VLIGTYEVNYGAIRDEFDTNEACYDTDLSLNGIYEDCSTNPIKSTEHSVLASDANQMKINYHMSTEEVRED
jgi:hypothetical protein